MNYSPKNLYVWDAWCMPVEDGVHLYHLQRARNEAGKSREALLGHAFSRDLIHWEELAEAFGPDDKRTDDDRQPWTGCALYHDKCAYLFYTMRGSATNCRVQSIGLATSPNGMTFTRYRDNPVIVPDPRWYGDVEKPVKGVRDCRDLVVVKAPDRSGWYGYFATRCPNATLGSSSAIAAAYSPDLYHWEQFRPVFTPENCPCVEVPDVFEMNGLWYMTCLTGMFYGTLRPFSEPDLYSGTLYAVSDSPLGPFRMLKNNVLLAAQTGACPLSVRSFEFEGERHILYTDREKIGRVDYGTPGVGTISTPKLLSTSGDTLQVRYSPRVEAFVSRECALDCEWLLADGVNTDWGQCWKCPPIDAQISPQRIILSNPDAFSVLPLNLNPESFIFEAEITLRGAASAGFTVRMTEWDGDFLRLDCERKLLQYLEHRWTEFDERRMVAFEPDRPYRLKLVSRLEHTEVYIDDILLMCFARYRNLGAGLGLFVDRGCAVFDSIRVRELAIQHQSDNE